MIESHTRNTAPLHVMQNHFNPTFMWAELAFEKATVGLLITDTADLIVHHNTTFAHNLAHLIPAAGDLKQLAGQMCGKAVAEWLETPQPLRKALYNCICEFQPEVFYSIDILPIFQEGGYTGAVWQFQDVSLHKKHELELKETQQKAEASAKSKEIFLANMSHEIRTPMNAIIGMAGLLEKTKLNPKQKSYLEALKISSEHLLVIINDILDVSKIEAGKLSLENIGFELYKIVSDSIQSLSYLAASKSVSLSYTLDAQLAKVYLGDPTRLEQIFLNLLSNAIKFTDVGSVDFHCQLLERQQQTDWIKISVTDTGIGIEQEKLKLIFESFTQADASITRHFGGTGLGLSITKQLVEMMDGTIEVESSLGKGTVFTLILPFEIGESADLPQVKQREIEYQSLRGVRVLLVEDNKWNQILGTAILEGWQMEVHTADNGLEAVERVKKYPYDIILMDIQMPRMGGVEAANMIKNTLKMNIPVVALTANAIKGDREHYLKAGMDDYVSKPFDAEELFKILSHRLGNWNQKIAQEEEAQTYAKVSQPLTVSMLAAPLYNLSKLEQHAQGNDAFIQKMIRLFREQTEDAMTELNECLQSGDWERIKAISHQIKPSIDLLCIEQLRVEVRMIEKFAENRQNLEQIPELIDKFIRVMKLVLVELPK